MVTDNEVTLIADAGAELPPAVGVYIEDDFVTNLMATVLDYQMQSAAVERAIVHFKSTRWDELRTIEDLQDLFEQFQPDREGNTAMAQHLWGYNMWTRAQQLRDLTCSFADIGVTDQPSLKAWAERSSFGDFQGRVKGLGPAVYQWLVMRQGVDTVKPDVHVRRFAENAVGRALSDQEVVDGVTGAAAQLGLTALELDWRIWEWSRANPH
jgi:hypothetical protein